MLFRGEAVNNSLSSTRPEERRRKEVSRALAGTHAGVIREYTSYPDLPNVMHLLAENFDILLVDVDSAEECALDLVESICCESSSAVMAYSERTESDVVVRAMRAGAREFLTSPFTASTLAEALIRASIVAGGSSPSPMRKCTTPIGTAALPKT